jgi:hypothetical protein
MRLARCLCVVFLSSLIVVPTVLAEQCPSGYRAVLEGSGPVPGGTVRQIVHMRKIDPGGYDGQWMVFRFEQYNTWNKPMPGTINEIVKDTASDGSPITGSIQGSGNETRTVMEGKLALLVAEHGRLRHFHAGTVEGHLSGNQITLQWLPTPNPALSGVITREPDPSLRVSPDRNFHAAGPHSEDRFLPRAITYLLTNCDRQPVSYAVLTPAKWLKISPAHGTIPPGGDVTTTVSLNGDLTAWDDGTYTEPIQFQNLTSGKGNTTRQAELEVKLHRWQVLLTGFEIDEMDPYWKLTTKVRGAIRFDYKLRSEFTVARKKGKWAYKSGIITIAEVGLSNLYEPLEAWAVKPLKCQNCNKVTSLKGTSQSGIVDGNVVNLYWGNAKPQVLVEAQIKMPCKPMPDCAQWKSRLFVSSEFLDRLNNVPLLLKHEGVVEPPKPIKDPQGLQWINYSHTLRRIE